MKRVVTAHRASAIAAAIAAVLLLVAITGGIWITGQIHAELFDVHYDEDALNIAVVGTAPGTITLRGDDADLRRPGVFGLAWPDGYTQVGAVVSADGREVTRSLLGPPPGPEVTRARLDTYAFEGDPLSARGIAFREVLIPTDVGQAPAWYVPGDRSTTVIFVHGRGAERAEALRALPTLVDLGFPALVITYRNDEELAGGSDGSFGFGADEWPDLEAAVAFALDNGADDVVLYAISMGGAIAMRFIEESPFAGAVRAVVMDAPMLQLSAVTELGLRERGVPGILGGPLRALVRLRYGVDWSNYDYRDTVVSLGVPILLFHGDDDDIVPVETSREVADAAPADLMTYIEVPGAGHVQAWNADASRYEGELKRFLEGLD